jgi:hypothetical protein
MKLKDADKLEVVNHSLRVNGRPFKVAYPSEPIACMEDGRLVTLVFRGCGCTLSHWDPEEIEGEFA